MRRAAVMAVVTLLMTCTAPSAVADPAVPGCTNADWNDVTTKCERTAEEISGLMATARVDGYHYRLRMQCRDGTDAHLCANPRVCLTPDGVPDGIWFKLLRLDVLDPPEGAGWEYFGEVCLRPGEFDRFRIITPGKVWDRMKELDWPTAEIVVQPPGGRTLVNFRTSVYTELDQTPKTKLVRMYGVPVTIEASPVTYTWHWGDETDPETTDWPGDPVPKNLTPDDLDDLITHEYLDADVTVTPSVDVTYSGRFRIDDSEWIAIEQTLTLPGPAVDLEVIEARVHLVG
jgi:hypothetical protein